MTLNNFLSSMYKAKLLYGVTFINEDDFCEIALVGWNEIGNKRIKLYKYIVCPENGEIELPCNCDIIEAVVAPGEDWNYTSNIRTNGDYVSSQIEEYIENLKDQLNPLYLHGHFIHYLQYGNIIQVDPSYNEVMILYKGVELDDDGLPYINDKEELAIATYVAYILKFKQGIQTNNPQIINLSKELEKKWLIAWNNAKQPEYISLNQIDEIANIKTSWNRKTYGKSYKSFLK